MKSEYSENPSEIVQKYYIGGISKSAKMIAKILDATYTPKLWYLIIDIQRNVVPQFSIHENITTKIENNIESFHKFSLKIKILSTLTARYYESLTL